MTEQAENEYVQQVYDFAAGLMQEGLADDAIRDQLVEQGLDAESAATVVSHLADARAEQKQAQGRKNMGFGALWFIGGSVVTAATYSAASAGGTYMVTWGAIALGVIQFLQGLYQYSRARS